MSPTLTTVDPSGEVGVMLARAKGRARRGRAKAVMNFIVAVVSVLVKERLWWVRCWFALQKKKMGGRWKSKSKRRIKKRDGRGKGNTSGRPGTAPAPSSGRAEGCVRNVN